jgi:hypothetical protein
MQPPTNRNQSRGSGDTGPTKVLAYGMRDMPNGGRSGEKEKWKVRKYAGMREGVEEGVGAEGAACAACGKVVL